MACESFTVGTPATSSCRSSGMKGRRTK
uniref:ATP synthase gamma chain n=1 Tax=Arundo donax TaxID=35708 RepID=A0A0A9DT58_ARUDO